MSSSEDKVAYSEYQRNRVHDIHEYGLDITNFMVYVQGVEDDPNEELEEPGVEYRMANRLIKNLDILSGIDASRPIIISMKTCGGSWVEGLAMYDAILTTPNPVSIINYTHAQSMSSIMFQAANKRIMMPHSYFMYHAGEYPTDGTWKQVMSDIKFAQSGQEQMLNIYVDALKRTPHSAMYKWGKARIKRWLIDEMDEKEDVYLLAEETISAGFADEIFMDWGAVTTYTKEQLARK